MMDLRKLTIGWLLVCGLISAAKAQFVVTVAGGTLEEVTNVATVGEVTNVATVSNAVINQGQFEALNTALTNLETILAGAPNPGAVAEAVQAATETPQPNEVEIATTNQPQYPLNYVVPGQTLQPNFTYNGSDLLSLNPASEGQPLYRPITGLTTSQWPENYAPFTAMEQKTDNAVKIFSQTSGNLENLRNDLLTTMNHLRQAKSMADIDATNARIGSIHAEITRQIYLRTAALQDVQLLQIANENNRLKREQAIAEEQSEAHQKQIGAGGGIGAATGLVVTAFNLIDSVTPTGGIQ